MFAIIGLILSAIGTGVTFVAAQRAASNAEAAAKAEQEAAYAQARNEEQQNAEAIARERINNRRRLARLHAEMAGTSGMVMDGSNMDVFGETSGGMELKIQDAARAGAMEAQNLRSKGSMALWEGRMQAASTRISSYGSLLTSGASLAKDYAKKEP
jgi:hypothetical protein